MAQHIASIGNIPKISRSQTASSDANLKRESSSQEDYISKRQLMKQIKSKKNHIKKLVTEHTPDRAATKEYLTGVLGADCLSNTDEASGDDDSSR